MTAQAAEGRAEPWETFVAQNGWRARATDLAFILSRTPEEVHKARAQRPQVKSHAAKSYEDLFSAWHGRAPLDTEWPTPLKSGQDGYEWQTPELRLLISLVGVLGAREIAQTLTARLRAVTGDQAAERTLTATNLRINHSGLQSADVLGGVTVRAAGAQIGSTTIVRHALAAGQLSTFKVGRLIVIPHGQWEAWLAKRVLPPEGYVQLSTLKGPLGIKSDKLSEWARDGLIPTALRVAPFGASLSTTKGGSWFISQEQADELLSKRKAAEPMPWHGVASKDNLKACFKRWEAKRHPAGCKACKALWGAAGAPGDFDSYTERYPSLSRTEKRHLTAVYRPGLTVREVATSQGASLAKVRAAVADGALASVREAGVLYIQPEDAKKWGESERPAEAAAREWIALETAQRQFLLQVSTLQQLISEGRIASKVGDAGAMRGIVYVSKAQAAQYRDKHGFTAGEAAAIAGVDEARLITALPDAEWTWRDGLITLAGLKDAMGRLRGPNGCSLQGAAELLKRPVEWVEARIADGTVRPSSDKAHPGSVYLTPTMLHRLALAGKGNIEAPLDRKLWLKVGAAAHEAGVSVTTVARWGKSGQVATKVTPSGLTYSKEGLRAAARTYWKSARYLRKQLPKWLLLETADQSSEVGLVRAATSSLSISN